MSILDKIEEDTKRGVSAAIAAVERVVAPGAASTAESTAPATIQSFAASATQSAPAASLSAGKPTDPIAEVVARLEQLRKTINVVATVHSSWDRIVDAVTATTTDADAAFAKVKALIPIDGTPVPKGFDEAVAFVKSIAIKL
jgi:beta-phosphoglucomutase-like phosphatase (HAD superfamily)